MKNTTKSSTSSNTVKNYNLKIKGEGQLINNDCLAGMKNLPDNSIDLVLTDPPYGIADKNRTTFVGSKGGKSITTQEAWGNDFQDNFGDVDGFWEWFKPFMSEMTRVTKDGGSIILFLDAKYQGHFVYLIEKEFGLKFRNNIIFTKNNARTLNMKGYAHSFEQAIWFTKGKAPFNYHNPMQELHKNNRNVFNGSVGCNKETKHPCEKYSWMIEPLIERHSLKNQLILDPFGGSASTLVYGIKQGRKVIAFEKNEKFFEMAKERIMKHNLDVRFFEPNKKIETKQQIKIEVDAVELNNKINELDDSAKKQVHEFIQSLLEKSDEFIDDSEPVEKVKKPVSTKNVGSEIIDELSNIKTNIGNDYMSEKTRSRIKESIINACHHLDHSKYGEELKGLIDLDFKQKLYCDIKTKVDFVNLVNRIKDKFNDCFVEELEEVA
ncbi:DNA-methyltransferase [Burkholderia multivorans]|uniref:DNA-methyltransferase n=1 Tax=Burkholderia multivorans TaxID=87883 RepID=UPI001C211CDF|nr:site-specific DNA-methyltransferase [Burkholderia multivorans]MBU9553884.1 site-specific DNA-methyltransferase [Burkholderia multivorans]